MSYSAIVAALEPRLEALSAVGPVHAVEPDSDGEPLGSSKIEDKFTDGSDGDRAHWWQIVRTGVDEVFGPEDSAVRVTTHEISIVGHMVYDEATSEAAVNAAVEAIRSDLALGDRTLGGACYTHDVPRWALAIARGGEEFFGSPVHVVRGVIRVEEQSDETATFGGSAGADDVVTGNLSTRLKKVGDAILAKVEPPETAGFVSVAWKRHPRSGIVYPNLPRERLPRIEIVALSGGNDSRTTGETSLSSVLRYAIQVLSLQTPGNDHQLRALRLAKRAVDPYFLRGMLPDLATIESGIDFDVHEIEVEEVVEEELPHALGDPRLTVSATSATLTLIGEIREC